MSNLDRFVQRHDVLLGIIDFTDRVGYPPTIKDLAEKTDLSVGTLYNRLTELKTMGLVTWQRGKPRTLSAVKETEHEDSE